jgi:hypothetical protein
MTPDQHRQLARRARAQLGLLTRPQALAAGVGPDVLYREVRQGRLRRVEPGVYQFTTSPVTWHSRSLALCLTSGGVTSHRAGAVLWDLDGFRPGTREITVERRVRVRRSDAIVHQTSRPDLIHPRRRAGVPVVGPQRLAVDLASVVGPDQLAAVVDQLVRRRLASVGDLVAALVAHAVSGRPGVTALRAVLVDLAGQERVPDSDWNRTVARRLVAAGLPAPTLEHEVRDAGGRFVARLDLAWPEAMTAVELDGEGTHLDRVAFQADRTKRNRLQLLGWRVLAFTWRDHLERFDQLLSQVEQALALAARPDSGDS